LITFNIVNKEIIYFRIDLNNLKCIKIFFVFLCNVKKLKSLDCTFLQENYLNLEKSLKHNNLLDSDGFYLFSSLKILR